MITWKLFVHVLLAPHAADNAIFLRDVARTPVWHSLLEQLGRRAGLRSALIAAAVLAWVVGILYANNLLFFLLPVLLAFTLLSALTMGPLVVEEREKHSWDVLRAVPTSLELILLGKMSGALRRLRAFLLIMTLLLFFVAAGVGLLSLVLIPVHQARTSWSEPALCGSILLVMLAGSTLYAVDRVQQYLLGVCAALAVGTASASSRMALLTASAAALLTWLLEILGTAALMTLRPEAIRGFSSGQLLSWATLGPVVSIILSFDPGRAAAAIVGVLLVREVLIAALWRWTLRAARE